MKRLLYILAIFLIFTRCNEEEPVSEYADLFGTWQLIEISGGPDNVSTFPNRNGDVYLLYISEEFGFERLLNTDVYSSGRINIETKASIVDGESLDIIFFEGEGIPQAAIAVSEGSLTLRDECIDCFTYRYSKL